MHHWEMMYNVRMGSRHAETLLGKSLISLNADKLPDHTNLRLLIHQRASLIHLWGYEPTSLAFKSFRQSNATSSSFLRLLFAIPEMSTASL